MDEETDREEKKSEGGRCTEADKRKRVLLALSDSIKLGR